MFSCALSPIFHWIVGLEVSINPTQWHPLVSSNDNGIWSCLLGLLFFNRISHWWGQRKYSKYHFSNDNSSSRMNHARIIVWQVKVSEKIRYHAETKCRSWSNEIVIYDAAPQRWTQKHSFRCHGLNSIWRKTQLEDSRSQVKCLFKLLKTSKNYSRKVWS